MKTRLLERVLPPRLASVRFEDEPPAFTRIPQTIRAAQAAGLRFERKVHTWLHLTYATYLSSPWISYIDKRQPSLRRYAQPDGILFRPEDGLLILIEIKLHHTPYALTQLRDKYLPLIRRLFPSSLWTYACCEVVRWYDPSTPRPHNTLLIGSLEDISPSHYNVLIYNP